MKELFKNHYKKIRIYFATETVDDPFEKNKIKTELPSLPIKAIVTDLTASQSQYKMIGIVADKSKEIIVEKKYRSLIEKSEKIEIDSEFYQGWKISGRMQIREIGEYLRVYVYINKI